MPVNLRYKNRPSGALAANSETPTADTISLAYFDRCALTRDSVAAQLAILLPDISVQSFGSALDIVSARSLARPGCIVFHTHSAGAEDPAVTDEFTRLRELLSGIPIIVLSELEVPDNIHEAIRSGAVAYIPTSLPLQTASHAIRLVLAGCSVIPAGARPEPEPHPDAVLASARDKVNFTPRQFEVLRGLWNGKQNKTIAYELSMSEGTVKVHVKNIMRKLNATNRSQVVLFLHRSLRHAFCLFFCCAHAIFSVIHLTVDDAELLL
jgi:DNA-binding NarL/FixJ family response regulator